MTHETSTSLPGAQVLARAKRFFAERVPHTAAFPEKEGPAFLVLRGQGGEELAVAVAEDGPATRVRASTEPAMVPASIMPSFDLTPRTSMPCFSARFIHR